MKIPDATLDWLLEPDNPPVRYLTLTGLLGKSDRSTEVRRARAELMEYGPTRTILEHADEFWGDSRHAYQKYRGEFWQLIFLGQFLADGRDPRIRSGVEGILARRDWIWKGGGQCLTANVLGAAMRLGFGRHRVVQTEVEELAKRVVGDGGLDCGAVSESLLTRCYMAQPKVLLCLTRVPKERRSKAVQDAIKLLSKNLVDHEVFVYVPGNRQKWLLHLEEIKKVKPEGMTVRVWVEERRRDYLAETGAGTPTEKAGWRKFGFPLHYNSDILESLHALAEADTPMSKSLERPLSVVREAMSSDGTWKLQNTLNGKMWADVEKKGRPSKWITWYAWRVLKHFDV